MYPCIISLRSQLATVFVLSVTLLSLVATLGCVDAHAQQCAPNFVQHADIASTCAEMSMTMLQDRMGRPFMYVANKSAGLNVYDVSDPTAPMYVNALDTSAFGGLDVMNLWQEGNYLYVALGNHFTNPQPGGVAIVNVTSPMFPFVTDYYAVAGKPSGGGMAVAQGEFIYLAAMQSGVVVIDASDKSNIKHVSTFLPDLNYPEPNPDTPKYNARGLEVRGDLLYLAFDAGGVRVLDIADKAHVTEVGRYSHSLLNGKPRAYNNLVVSDTLIYVTTDFCGLEVLSAAQTSNLHGLGWWNPIDCVNGNWFSSPIHTNEIRLDSACKKVYVSAGRTEVLVIDVTNPHAPDSCAAFGVAEDDIASWGIDVYQNRVMFSYVCALIPFTSLKTGVKILTYSTCTTSAIDDPTAHDPNAYDPTQYDPTQYDPTPNDPAHGDPAPSSADPYQSVGDREVVTIYNMLGEQMVDTRSLPTGVYFEVRSGTIQSPSRPSHAAPIRGVLRMHVNGADHVTYNTQYRP